MRYLISIMFLFVFVTSGNGQVKTDSLTQNAVAMDSVSASGDSVQTDSVNIRAIVEAQINAVKKRELETPARIVEFADLKKSEKVNQRKAALSDKWNSLLDISISPLIDKIYNTIVSADETTIKISILGFASLLAFLIVVVRRKFLKRRPVKRVSLKDNIKLLREEKVIKKSNPKLTGIRNSLVNNPLSYKKTQSGISRVAKELNIAKGELMLAAKINSHELNKSWTGSFNKKMGGRIL